jgi:VWFA-related protein
VKLDVLVVDDKNQPVVDLRQEDFQVFEGDSPQTVSYFAKVDSAVSYGLLLDNSGSMKTQLGSLARAGETIIRSNGPGDETMLIRFISSGKIELLEDFSSDKEVLLKALKTMYTEGGRTAVIDAIYVAAESLRQRKADEDPALRRRSLVLVTDGEERGSSYSKEKLIKFLRTSDIQILIIGMVSELDKEGHMFPQLSAHDKAVALLKELAQETGGHVLFTDKKSDLSDAATKVASYLHTRYVIGYNPTGQPRKDPYRKVRVKLVEAPGRTKLKVITRPGYVVQRQAVDGKLRQP